MTDSTQRIRSWGHAGRYRTHILPDKRIHAANYDINWKRTHPMFPAMLHHWRISAVVNKYKKRTRH
ncbi:hypothetical protein FKO59_20835 [Burkholderia pseudomallei]|nr:hypothetical protein BOC37_01145 [Burkholderia pseudomallei]ARK71153.1 hypothetical protein BOC38_32345 [Burkholderia pseudomallei]ARK74379.1 hypothetical protein BOC39_12770 [Burkholderia pseudomallei]ARK91015.1 hypothetical protein BOC42_27685 [Burkholderia pseudomallei]ARL06949.1 hypothetical protein BOC44_37070 [Burkholderia pseudomallei]